MLHVKLLVMQYVVRSVCNRLRMGLIGMSVFKSFHRLVRLGLHHQLPLFLNAIAHIENMAKDDSLVDLKVGVEIFNCELSVVCPELAPMAFLSVDLVELLRE